MIIVTVGDHSLNFGSGVLCVKQQDIPCFSLLDELPLGHGVFIVIHSFNNCFEHELAAFLME